jgi:cytoskeleton protein RodZ
MSAEPQAPGARLRAERERRGLSLQKAADEMRLDAWVVEALEADDYARVGPSVYAKGHLKKYASLLTLPWEEILAGYEARRAAPAPVPAAPLRVAAATAGSRAPRGRLAGALVLILIGAGVLWWKPWQQRSAATATGAAHLADASAAVTAVPDSGVNSQPGTAASDADDDNEPPVAGDAAARDLPSATPARASTAAPPSAAAPLAAAAAEHQPPPGAGVVRLRMSFSAESWVEVHDAAGHRVYSGYGQANSVKTLVGEGPLRVYLGFASGVQLEINEHAVAIGSGFVHADVARFQAGADGVLRSFANDARPQG